MPSVTSHKLMEACREPGCPVCRLEQQGVERYLDNQLYENVNSPAWRDHLRASQGFCREHAWLGVEKRLGDALGFSIIYHDLVNNLIKSLNDNSSARATRSRASVLGPIPESMRSRVEGVLDILTPRKRCPACEHREELTRGLLSVLVEDLPTPAMMEALQASEGLCLPHLGLAVGYVKDVAVYDMLLTVHTTKLESLRNELAEFIRKNDYRVITEGFGSEGNAWLRAIRLLVGSRKER